MYSLIVPVYKNEDSIKELVAAVVKLSERLKSKLEVIFVVDGSPDKSFINLRELIPLFDFSSKLILLSRNFGSFAAIRVGLQYATGPYFAVMAADLQEPPDLVIDFFVTLKNEPYDVVIGTREGRNDPLSTRIAAETFWFLYRKFIVREMPVGGVDVFGCNQAFRDQILNLEESHSSLIALLFWLGFRRKLIKYKRLPRNYGKSAWTLNRKINYFMDSIFAFSDLPIKLLISIGGVGIGFSVLLSIMTLIAKLAGWITVPGYAATILVLLFFGALNIFSLGLVGSYTWRSYENSKRRPLAIPMDVLEFNKMSGSYD